MNGMHCEWWWAYNTGGDWYTTSYHYELPPTPTIAELSMIDYFEFDDRAQLDLGFTHIEYLDNGVTRHDDFANIDSFDSTKIVVHNALTRVDWSMQITSCATSHLINLFYWDSVS